MKKLHSGMWEPQMNKVERATRVYWEVSLAYHKRPEGKNISVMEAMSSTRIAAASINPGRKVVTLLYDLGVDIIHGGKRHVKQV
jgi:hypothetical protein